MSAIRAARAKRTDGRWSVTRHARDGSVHWDIWYEPRSTSTGKLLKAQGVFSGASRPELVALGAQIIDALAFIEEDEGGTR